MAVAMAGCDGAPSSEPPSGDTAAPLPPYAALRETRLGMSTLLEGAPLVDAVVIIRQTPERGGGIVGMAKTDERGRATATLSLPVDETEVDVIVQRSGARGPWTDAEQQAQAGAFGPASIERHTIDELSTLELELVAVAP